MKKISVFVLFVWVSFLIKAEELPNTLTPQQKLFGLSKVWSEAKYNAAFFDNIGVEKWDSAYRAFMQPVMDTPNDYTYFRELTRFCALLRDGHSWIHYRSAPYITTLFDKLQWNLSCIEGKAIVTGISSKQKDLVPVGSEIVEVNGMPTAAYLDAYVIPYISSSTDYVQMNQAVSSMFRSLKGDSYQVKIVTPSGKIQDMKITHDLIQEVMDDPMVPEQKPWKLIELKWYPGGIAYVALNSFGNSKIVDEFKAIFPELKQAKKLIIDLRSNGGGNTGNGTAILKYLTPDNQLVGSRWQTRVHNPAYMSWGGEFTPQDTANNKFAAKAYLSAHMKYYEYDDPGIVRISSNHERLVVPTVLLIGHNTASAAEDFLIYADQQKHMTKIGQRSNGSTGNPIIFELEGGGVLAVCSKKDTYPDGREFVGYGVKPDIEVIPTVKDLIKEYDRGLEEALRFLKK